MSEETRPSMTISADGGDARIARSERTRLAVIDALLALIYEGEPQPGARRVAERAGVSTRTVFAHFASLEDLYRISAERVAAKVISLLTPIAPDQPLATRIDSLSTQRARVNEEIGPIRRAAALQEPFSPALAVARVRGRRASYEQLNRVFARELSRLDGPTRRRCVATLDAVISGEAWDLLRGAHGLSPDAARLAVGEAVHALFAAASPPPARKNAVRADDEGGPRVKAAQRALADVEQRIARLVAAIEAGLPADVLVPRLEALRAARLAAERELADARAGRAAAAQTVRV